MKHSYADGDYAKRLWQCNEGSRIVEVACFVRKWRDREIWQGGDELCVALCWVNYGPRWVQVPKITRWLVWTCSQHSKGLSYLWQSGQPRRMKWIFLPSCICVWITRIPIQVSLSPSWLPASSEKFIQHYNTYTCRVNCFLPRVEEGVRQWWGYGGNFWIGSSSTVQCARESIFWKQARISGWAATEEVRYDTMCYHRELIFNFLSDYVAGVWHIIFRNPGGKTGF